MPTRPRWSKVRIATTSTGYERMCEYADTHTKEGRAQLLGCGRAPGNFEEHRGCVVFGWDDISWYEEYEDVKNVIDALDALGCDDVPYRMVRVGEDWDDVEVKDGDYYGALNIGIAPCTDIETNMWEE